MAAASRRQAPVAAQTRSDARPCRQYPVVWFTQRSGFGEEVDVSADSTVAQRARDVLGLDHIEQGEMIVALHFPGSAAAARCRRPTFLDGAGQSVPSLTRERQRANGSWLGTNRGSARIP